MDLFTQEQRSHGVYSLILETSFYMVCFPN